MSCFKNRFNMLFEDAKNADYRITQQQFADKFGASRGQFQGWLDGRGEPDSETLKKIAEISHVSVDWLVGASDLRRPYNLGKESRSYKIVDDEIEEYGVNKGVKINDDIVKQIVRQAMEEIKKERKGI